MSLQDRINECLLEKHAKKTELATAVKSPRATISDWTSGKTKSLSGEKLLLASAFFNVNPKWLATGLGEKNKLKTKTSQQETNTPRKPPVIDEEEWKALPPKARALVEDFLIKSSRGELSESSIKLLQNTVDELSKEK